MFAKLINEMYGLVYAKSKSRLLTKFYLSPINSEQLRTAGWATDSYPDGQTSCDRADIHVSSTCCNDIYLALCQKSYLLGVPIN